MEAKLPDHHVFNGKNLTGKKPVTGWYHAVAVHPQSGQLVDAVSLVVWHTHSRGTNYASVWVYGDKTGFPHLAGHGKATGWGYHRASAAAAEAFESAGITLDEDVAGVGSRAVEDVLRAITRALGYEQMIVVGNGI